MSDSPRVLHNKVKEDFYESMRNRPVTPATSVNVEAPNKPARSHFQRYSPTGLNQSEDDSMHRNYGLVKVLGSKPSDISKPPLSSVSRLGDNVVGADGYEVVKSQLDDSDIEITENFQREKIRSCQFEEISELNAGNHLANVPSRAITMQDVSSNKTVVVLETHRSRTPRPGANSSEDENLPVYPTSVNKSKLSRRRRRRTQISNSQQAMYGLPGNHRSVHDEENGNDVTQQTYVRRVYSRDDDEVSDVGASDYSAQESAGSTINPLELCRPDTTSSEILTVGALASKEDKLLKSLMKILKIENVEADWFTGIDEHDENSISSKLRRLTKLFYKREENDSSSVGLVYTYKLLLGSLNDRLEDFVLLPVPPGFNVRARITRTMKGIRHMFNPMVYYLHLEREGPGDRKCLILVAKKHKGLGKTTYSISTDPSDFSKNSEYYLGRIESNFIGTEFTLYGGRSICIDVPPEKGALLTLQLEERFKEELALVLYDPNVLGFKGPRKIKVIIPKMKSVYEREQVLPTIAEETLLYQYRNEEEDSLLCLKNKEPMWSKESHSYILNFGGRVSTPSVKNFQVVCPENIEEDNVMLQFGRASPSTFSLDFKYPFCPLQAFAIALTSFESKLACE